MVPTVKLSSAAAIGPPAAETRPLTACCQLVAAPASSGSSASSERSAGQRAGAPRGGP